MQPALNRRSGVRLSGEEPHASVAQPARASRCQREGRGFEPRRVPSQSARRRCRFAPVAEWIEAPAFQAGHTGSIPVWGSPQKQVDDGGLAERLLQRTVNPPPTGLRRFESCGRHCFGCRTWPATWVPKLEGRAPVSNTGGCGLAFGRLRSSRLARGRLRVRPPLTPSPTFAAPFPVRLTASRETLDLAMVVRAHHRELRRWPHADSSAGRAPRSHRGGRRFNPCSAYHRSLQELNRLSISLLRRPIQVTFGRLRLESCLERPLVCRLARPPALRGHRVAGCWRKR
jgi:hypothetical protein